MPADSVEMAKIMLCCRCLDQVFNFFLRRIKLLKLKTKQVSLFEVFNAYINQIYLVLVSGFLFKVPVKLFQNTSPFERRKSSPWFKTSIKAQLRINPTQNPFVNCF